MATNHQHIIHSVQTIGLHYIKRISKYNNVIRKQIRNYIKYEFLKKYGNINNINNKKYLLCITLINSFDFYEMKTNKAYLNKSVTKLKEIFSEDEIDMWNNILEDINIKLNIKINF